MVDWTRLVPAFITQMGVALIFLYIAYKILRKKRNGLTLSLGAFYILLSSSFIINIIYFPLEINPIVFILHLIAVFLFFFGLIFLLIFNINLYLNQKETKKIQYVVIISYCILIVISLLLLDGISLDESTDWRPQWSWNFSILIIILFTGFIVIPNSIITLKKFHQFKDPILRKKIILFMLGFTGCAFSVYGGILYNTLSDPVFEAIWSILSLIGIFWGILIFYGVGQEL